MEAGIVSALIQAGGAVAVAIAFIWYLDRRDKAQVEKDKQAQSFFQEMHTEDNKSVTKLADVIDSLVEKVQALTTKFDNHDQYERQKFEEIESKPQNPTRPRASR